MAEYMIQNETLTAIADAVRAKSGATGALTPSQMAAAIEEIKTGAAINGLIAEYQTGIGTTFAEGDFIKLVDSYVLDRYEPLSDVSNLRDPHCVALDDNRVFVIYGGNAIVYTIDGENISYAITDIKTSFGFTNYGHVELLKLSPNKVLIFNVPGTVARNLEIRLATVTESSVTIGESFVVDITTSYRPSAILLENNRVFISATSHISGSSEGGGLDGGILMLDGDTMSFTRVTLSPTTKGASVGHTACVDLGGSKILIVRGVYLSTKYHQLTATIVDLTLDSPVVLNEVLDTSSHYTSLKYAQKMSDGRILISAGCKPYNKNIYNLRLLVVTVNSDNSITIDSNRKFTQFNLMKADSSEASLTPLPDGRFYMGAASAPYNYSYGGGIINISNDIEYTHICYGFNEVHLPNTYGYSQSCGESALLGEGRIVMPINLRPTSSSYALYMLILKPSQVAVACTDANTSGIIKSKGTQLWLTSSCYVPITTTLI